MVTEKNKSKLDRIFKNMSSAAHTVAMDGDGGIDFDFFDTPKEFPTSSFEPQESKSEQTNSKVVYASDSSDSGSGSENYASDRESSPVPKANVRKIEATVPVAGRESYDFSDSDKEHEADRVIEDAKPKRDSKKPESGGSQKTAWETSEKPKTGPSKPHGRSRTTSNGKSKYKESKYDPRLLSSSDESSELSSDSDTDSDVTEVSPLNSPHKHGASKDMYDMRELSKLGKPPRSPMHKETVSYSKAQRPTSAKSKDNKLDKLLNADSDQMDLQLLMQAVMEIEQDREQRQRKQRRVLFAGPPPKPKPQAKLNQTFSNDKVRTIDRENQRLMQRIMVMQREAEAAKVKAKKPKPVPKQEPPRLTASAVNRLNEQRRIERENLAMLKRLQKTRATKEVQRDNLLTTYNTTMIAGHSIAESHPPQARGKHCSPYESHSSSCVNEDIGMGMGSTGKRTRPSSAKSTLSTVSMRSSKSTGRPGVRAQRRGSRPDWESGW